MSARLFRRCRHCGLAHKLDDMVCEVTGKSITNADGIFRSTAATLMPPDSKQPDDPYIGHVLGGRYRPVRLIGEGGSASVYECENMTTGTRVAMKIPHRAYVNRRNTLKRFYQEAHVVKVLQHPSICSLLDMGQLENGRPFLVIELLKGETLERRLERLGPMNPTETCRIGMVILEALQVAHQVNIIHQDIKPANVFLCKGGAIKLLDFGLSANLIGEARTGSASGNKIIGTPLYLAPESFDAPLTKDHRIDIYAVGVMLHECLLGYPPFYSQTIPELLEEIRNRGPVRIGNITRGVSPELIDVLERAVDKKASKRWPSAAHMQAALAAIHARLVHVDVAR